MKKLFLLVVFSLLLLNFVTVNVHAEVSLFVSSTCPHCKNVEAKLEASGEGEQAGVDIKVIDKDPANYTAFYSAITKCGIDSNQAGVPLLFNDDKCYIGEIEVIDRISELAKLGNFENANGEVKAEEANLSETPTAIPVVNPGIPLEEAKTNTLIFIIGMSVALGLLVAVGYWKQNSEKKNINTIALLTMTIAGFNALVISNPVSVKAFCPVCTIAVGAGLGFSKQLGIDDVITSIWIGGLLVSMSLWTIEWLTKKNIKFLFRKPLIFLVMYALVIWPLASTGVIGAMFNVFWGIDKVVLGIIIGSLGFLAGYVISDMLTKNNGNKVYFPFQKVVFPLSMLILLSLVFFFLVY